MARLRIQGSIIILIILISVYHIPVITSHAQQENNAGWKLIVMPFFSQANISGAEGYQAVYLYSFGRLLAGIDLNHNGVVDSDEPVINITRPGEIIKVGIGVGANTSSFYIDLKGYKGDLWILTKYPIMATFMASDGEGYVASYNVPPPGQYFVIPNIKSIIYISPATTRSVEVTVQKASKTDTYNLDPGSYLVIDNSDGKKIIINSTGNISVVLGNPGVDGENVFFSEVPPLTQDYMVSYNPIPFPEIILNTSLPFSNARTIAYIVDEKGETFTIYYEAQEILKDVLKNLKAKDYKGYAIIQIIGKSKNGKIVSAAAPYYNFRQLSQLLTGLPYAAEWFTLVHLYNETGVKGEITLLDVVPLAYDAWPQILYDMNNDNIADIIFRALLSTDIKDSHLILSPRIGKSSTIMIKYWDLRVAPYYLLTDKDFSHAIIEVPAIPVPRIIEENQYNPYTDYLEIYDLKSGKYPFVVHKYNNSMITPSATTLSYAEFSFHFEHSVESKINCTMITYYAFAVTKHLETFVYNETTGCDVHLKYKGVLPLVFYLMPVPIAQGKVILDETYPAIITPSSFTGSFSKIESPPSYPVIGASSGVFTDGTAEPIIYKNIIIMDHMNIPDSYQPMINYLTSTHTTPPPPPTTTKTTTTPQKTTTSKTTHTTSSPRTTITTKKGKTTTGKTITTRRQYKIPVKNGDILTYEVKASGSGPKGSAKGSGIVKLSIMISGDKLKLIQQANTLPNDTKSLLILTNTISDIFTLAASGTSETYQLPGFSPFFESTCPIFNPNAGSKTINGTTQALLYSIDYQCNYQNGVLVYAKAVAHGAVGGHSFKVVTEARLKYTSITGIKAVSTGSKTSIPVITIAIMAALIIIAIFAAILIIKRR